MPEGLDSNFRIPVKPPLNPFTGKKPKRFVALIAGIVFAIAGGVVAVSFAQSKNNNHIALMMASLFFVVFAAMVITVFTVIKKIKKLKGLKTNEEPGFIEVSDDQLIFPSYLIYRQDSPQPGNDKIHIQLAHIKDFEQIPGGKNSSPHFQIIIGGAGKKEQKIHVLNQIGKANTKKLLQAMHQASGLPDRLSPFGATAQKTRQQKQTALLICIFAGTFAWTAFFIMNHFFSPLHPWAAGLSFLVYGLIAALPISIFLRGNVFTAAFKKGFGTELPFWLLFSMAAGLGSLLASGSNFLLAQPLTTIQVSVSGKKRVRNKNRLSYYAMFNLQTGAENYLYDFQEKSSVKVNKKKYEKIKTGQSQVQLEISQGALGAPLIKKYTIIY